MLDRKKLQEIFGKISHYAGRVLEANITEQDETDLKNLIQKIEFTDELSFVIKETNNLPQEIKTEIYAAYKNIFTAQAAKIIMDSDAKNIEELLSIKQKFNDLPKSAGNILEMQPLYEALANKAINILTASKDIDTLLRIRTKEFNKLPDKVLEVLSKKPIADIFAKRAGEIMRSIVQQTATLEALQSVINQYNKLPADAHQKLLLSSLLSNKAMQMIKTADNPQQVLSIYNIMKGEQIFNVDSAKKAADNRLKELELQHKVISQAVRSGLQQKTHNKRVIDAPRTANSVVSRIQGQVKGLVKKIDVSKQSKGLVKHLKRNVRDMEQLIRGVSSNGNPFSEKQKGELYTKIKESLVVNLAMYNNLAKSDGFTSNMEKTILPIIDRCKTLSNELEADLHHKQMAIAVLMKDIPNDVAELTRLVHKFSSDPTEKRKNKIMEGISILNQEFKEAERTIHDSSIVSEIKALQKAFETETEKFNEYLEQNEHWKTDGVSNEVGRNDQLLIPKDIADDVAELTRLVHKFSSDPTEKRKNKIMEGISILNREFKEAERTIHDPSIVSEIKALKTAFETETEKFNEYLEQNEDWETVDDLKRSLKSSTPIRSPATLPDNKHDVSKKTEINDPAQSEFKSPVFFESHATRAEPSHTIKPHNDSKITAVVRALGRVLPARIKDRYVQPEEQAKLLMQNINKDMKGLEKLIDKASSDKKSLEKYGEKILKMISDLRHSFDNYDDLAKNANIPSADKFKEQFKQSTETFYQSINKFADTIGHQKSSKGMPFLDRLADQIFVKSVLDQSGTLFKPNRCRKLFAFVKVKLCLKKVDFNTRV